MKRDRDKPLLLFTTPRTGSTPVYRVLNNYLSQNYGTQGLGELLTTTDASFWDNGNGITRFEFPRVNDGAAPGDKFASGNREELILKVRAARIALLRKYPTRYFFKLFPQYTIPEDWDWLSQNYRWIFLERRNLFEQVLSFEISIATGHFYGEGPMQEPPPRSIRVNRQHFLWLENQLFRYIMMKKALKPAHVIYFEDFLKRPFTETLRQSGLEGPFDESRLKLTHRVHPWDKSASVANLSQLEKWYRNSFLNRISPL